MPCNPRAGIAELGAAARPVTLMVAPPCPPPSGRGPLPSGPYSFVGVVGVGHELRIAFVQLHRFLRTCLLVN